MLIGAQSNLDWHTNEPKKNHTVDLNCKIQISDIFQSSDPVTELAVRGTEIRRLIVQILSDENLPQMIADTGRHEFVPGYHESDLKTKWNANWSFRRSEGNGKPELHGTLQMKIDITTNRQIHAVQAIELSRVGIADSLAEALMGALRLNLHGTKSTNSSAKSETRDGYLTEYRATERGTGNN